MHLVLLLCDGFGLNDFGAFLDDGTGDDATAKVEPVPNGSRCAAPLTALILGSMRASLHSTGRFASSDFMRTVETPPPLIL
jgi:hypothetical protein